MRVVGLSSLLTQALLPTATPKNIPVMKPAEEAPASAAPAVATSPATSVQMLVAMAAAAEPAVERRRRMAADTEKGLRGLERLYAEMLTGAPSVERLREIAEWSETLVPPEDPELARIAAEIDLRVRVELAKHEVRA